MEPNNAPMVDNVAWQATAQTDANLTDQDRGHLLLLGWQAARNNEPLDWTQPWHWVQGFRLYCSTHRP